MKDFQVWCLAHLTVISTSWLLNAEKIGGGTKKENIKPTTTNWMSSRPSTDSIEPLTAFKAIKTRYSTDRPFRSYIKSKSKYVDKTEFIAELLTPPGHQGTGTPIAFAIFRPRSYGKTMALDMVREFFQSDRKDTVFTDDMAIMHPKYKEIHDKYMHQTPVIFMTFTHIGCQPTYEMSANKLHELLKDVYEEYRYLLNSSSVSPYHKEFMEGFLKNTDFGEQDFEALRYLGTMILKHHGRSPFIIFDEVDSPIANATLHGVPYFVEMKTLMTRFHSSSLKENQAYQKAILAGVQPIVRYLPNNIRTFTICDDKLDSFFGFTETEVEKLMKETNRGSDDKLRKNLKLWYNNLRIGDQDIYTPKSIIASFEARWALKPTATASDSLQYLTEYLLTQNGLLPSLNFQVMFRNLTLKKKCSPEIYFDSLLETESEVWTYFINAGIVTANPRPSVLTPYYLSEIRLTSLDTQNMLKKLIDKLFSDKKVPDYDKFTELLEDDDYPEVRKMMKCYIDNAGNYLSKATEDELGRYIRIAMKLWSSVYGGEVMPMVVRNNVEIEFYDKRGKLKVCFRVQKAPSMWEKFKKVVIKRETIVTRFNNFLITMCKLEKSIVEIEHF